MKTKLKKIISMLLTVVLLIGMLGMPMTALAEDYPPVSGSDGNLIQNPGFESGNDSWDWTDSNTGVDAGNSKSGTKFAWLDPGKSNVISQNVTIPKTGTYRLSTWLTAGGSGGVFGVKNSSGDIIKSENIPGNTAYFYVKIDELNFAQNDTVQVFVSGGNSWVNTDDFELKLDTGEPDQTDLGVLIAQVQGIDKSDYPADTWTALQTALSEALVVYNNSGASQTDITDTYNNLTAAMRNLGYLVDNITIQPGADEKQMNFCWQSVSDDTCYLYIAKKSEMTGDEFPLTAQSYRADTVASSSSGKYSSEATVTGLEAAAEYVYRIGDGSIYSKVYGFHTNMNTDGYSAILIGDPQVGASGDSASDTLGWKNTITTSLGKLDNTDFILSAGDQVNYIWSDEQYDGFFSPTELKSVPLAPTVGNHDNDIPHQYHFSVPNESTSLGRTDAGGDYWFIYENTLYMVLNTNNMSATTHKEFIAGAKSANPDVTWNIVMLHHSIYSSASHSTENKIVDLRSALYPVFDEFGIDVVLMGHDHCYTRSYQMYGGEAQTSQTVDSEGRVVNPSGTLYITAGSSSGSKYYDMVSTPEAYSAVRRQDYTPTYSYLEVGKNTFSVTTYLTGNDTPIDTYTIYKDNALRIKNPVPEQTLETGGSKEVAASVLAEGGQKDKTITAIITNSDSSIATASLSSGSLIITGTGAGKTSVTVAVNDGAGTVNVEVPIIVQNNLNFYFGFDIKSSQLKSEDGSVVSPSFSMSGTNGFTFEKDNELNQTVLCGPESGNLVIDGLNLAALNSQYTVEAYINISSKMSAYDVYQFTGQNMNLVGLPGETYFGSGRYSGGDADVYTDKNLLTDQWIHVLCTAREGEQKLYVNGAEFASDIYTGLYLTSTSDDELVLGGSSGGRSGLIKYAYLRMYRNYITDNTKATQMYQTMKDSFPADYTAVDEAISKIPADLSVYTDDSVDALNTALNAVNRDKKITEQSIVDGYAAAIENAVDGLTYKGGADYTAVGEAISKIPADLSVYTDQSVKILKDAKDAVIAGKNISEQDIVDGYAAAIENAIKTLVYKGAVYTLVDQAIAKVPPDLNSYTTNSVTVLKNAENAVDRDKNITEQSIVDGYAAVIENAISALVYKAKNINLTVGAKASELYVNWYSGNNETGKVQYSEAANLVNGNLSDYKEITAYSNGETEDSRYYYNHTFIHNLEPGTKYAYRVGCNDDWSEFYTFATPSSDDVLNVLFAADPQVGAGADLNSDIAGWTDTMNLVMNHFPDTQVLLMGGDQINKASNGTQYDGFFAPSQFTSLPIATVVGNHDVGSKEYSRHFAYANVSEETGKETTGEYGGDYWFVRDNTLFMVLNSNIVQDVERDTQAHINFMQKAISSAGSEIKWKVVLLHHSIYSTGKHSNDSLSIQRREAWAPVFSDLQIDIALMGHDHVYCRSKLMDGTTPITMDGAQNTVTDPDPEQVLYVTGNSSSGSKFYDITVQDAEFSALTLQGMKTVSKLEISDKALTMATYNAADMTLLDTFTINKTVTKDTMRPFLYVPTANDVDLNQAFDKLSGVSAIDNVDGDITGSIVVTGDVDTSVPGIYTLYYEITDAAGNTATATRKITVGNILYFGIDIKNGELKNEAGSAVSSSYQSNGNYKFAKEEEFGQTVLCGPESGNLVIDGLNLPALNNQFTLEAYVNISSTMSAYDTFQFAGQNINLVGVPGATYFGAGRCSEGDADVYTDKNIPTDQWVHILCTAKEGEQKLYVNGMEFASNSYTDLNLTSTSDNKIILGGSGTGRSGLIKYASFRIYSNFINDKRAEDMYHEMKERFSPAEDTIDISDINGVGVPVTGAAPTAVIADTTEYTATISWMPEDTVFRADTVYKASITITPKKGYTLKGVPKNFFKIAGARSVINEAASGVIIAEFPATKALESAVLNPAVVTYDLNQPEDVHTSIIWNSAQSIVSVKCGSEVFTSKDIYSVSGSAISVSGSAVSVSGSALTIKSGYLFDKNLKQGETATFHITFDNGNTASLTVNIVNGYIPSNDASLNYLTIGGKAVKGFTPELFRYDIKLPYGVEPGSEEATVYATSGDPKAEVKITQAATLPGSAIIVVTAEDKLTTKTYTVNLTLSEPQKPAYTLTISAKDGGSILTGDNGAYTEGTLINISAAPLANYRFSQWSSSNGGSFGNVYDASTTFTMPAQETTITASFTYMGGSYPIPDVINHNDSHSDSDSDSDSDGNKEPVIKEGELSGWNSIENYIKDDKKENLTVEMKNNTVVPGSLFKTIRGKDIQVSFLVEDGIEWIVKGEDIPETDPDKEQKEWKDIDLKVTKNTDAVPSEAIDPLLKSEDITTIPISLNYEGEFGFTATLRMDLGSKNAGRTANLFYYNPNSGELELQEIGIVDKNGYSSFEFKHASDYVVMMDNGTVMEEELKGITVTPESKLLYVGGSVGKRTNMTIEYPQSIKAMLENDICTPEITYQSGDKNVAFVLPNGKIYALNQGETTITTVITMNGVSISFKSDITVKEAYIELIQSTDIMKKGQSYLFQAVGHGVDTGKISWKTTKKSMVVINKTTGKAKAMSSGVDYVVAKAGSIQAKMKVKVK